MFEKILVGYDGSKGGKAALQRAVEMARQHGANITVLWVREPLPRHSDLPAEFEGEAEAADEYFKARQTEVTEVANTHGIYIACETRRGHPRQNHCEVRRRRRLRPHRHRPQ